MTDYRDADVYLQFEKGRYAMEMKLVNATAKKPTKPRSGAVVVKLSVRIPYNAFEPLSPEAIVTIEEGLGRQVLQVVAIDPGMQTVEVEGDGASTE